jgi:hypothetical protein
MPRLLQMHEEMEAFESSEDSLQYLEKLVMKKGIRTGTPWRMNKRFKVCLSVTQLSLYFSINSVHSGSPIQISHY